MRPDRRGYSLVEVLLATIVLAVIASSIIGVMATVGRGRTETESRMAASQGADTLRAALRNYTLAWPQSGEPAEQDLAAFDGAFVGVAGCASNCRVLPGDLCPWALALGCHHDATSLLPSSLTAPPKSAKMAYDVAASPDGSRTAFISVSWNR